MIKIRKHTALFAIIPLFAVALMIGYIGDVAAINEGTVDNGGDHERYGMDTGQSVEQFLSDAKATEPEAKTALTNPYFDLVDVQKASANSEDLFKAIYTVYAGEQDVTDIQLLVKSDKDSILTTIGGISEMASSPVTVVLKASDPGSISAEILDWKLDE